MQLRLQFEPGKGPAVGKPVILETDSHVSVKHRGWTSAQLADWLLLVGEPHGLRGIACYTLAHGGDEEPYYVAGEYITEG